MGKSARTRRASYISGTVAPVSEITCRLRRLRRVLPDDDLAVEDGPRRAAGDALVALVAAVVRLGMVDRRVVVDQPIAVGEIEAVQRAVAAFAVEERVGVVTHELPAEGERMR